MVGLAFYLFIYLFSTVFGCFIRSETNRLISVEINKRWLFEFNDIFGIH